MIESVTTHEIGHFFGLGDEYRSIRDCKNHLSVMGGYYCRYYPISPFDHDIQNLKSKYDVYTFKYGSVAGIETLTPTIKVNEIGKVIDLPIEFQIIDAKGDGVKNATVLFPCSSEKIQILSGVIATSDLEGKVRIDQWKVSEGGSYSIRDAQSYFAIVLDDNNRKTICRFYLNGSKKYIVTFDENKKEIKAELKSLVDIYSYSELLFKIVTSYEKTK